jgi:hypothetical protein
MILANGQSTISLLNPSTTEPTLMVPAVVAVVQHKLVVGLVVIILPTPTNGGGGFVNQLIDEKIVNCINEEIVK